MAQKQRRAKNVLPSQRTRKPPGGFSSRGAALLADLKLMHPHDQGVFRTLGVDDQMQLVGSPHFEAQPTSFCQVGAQSLQGDFWC